LLTRKGKARLGWQKKKHLECIKGTVGGVAANREGGEITPRPLRKKNVDPDTLQKKLQALSGRKKKKLLRDQETRRSLKKEKKVV